MAKNRFSSLKTARLILRELCEDDWQAIHTYSSDPEAVKYLPWISNTEKDTREFVQKRLAAKEKQPRDEFTVALIHRSSNHLIGTCTLFIRNAAELEGEIGYVLNRKYWHQGYAAEAAERVVSFGFEKLKLHRVYATCNPDNTASYRLMEKIGMQREGCLRSHRWIKGGWRDSLLYSILEPEWRHRKENTIDRSITNELVQRQ